MATQAQIEANRANAQKSTGPRTDEGKTKVAQNAVKHGLRGEQVVIEGEDVGAFEFYREAMLAELNPVGPVECTLAERVVGLAWRLRRVEQMQAEVFDTLLAKDLKGGHVRDLTRSVLPKAIREKLDNTEHGETALGRATVRDFSGDRVLDRLGLYERRIERSFYKAMGELERLRAMREIESFPRTSEGTRGLRTHPTIARDKSEIRSTKFETNTNDTNLNDKAGLATLCGSVKAEGLGDGEYSFGNHHRHAAHDAATPKVGLGTNPGNSTAENQNGLTQIEIKGTTEKRFDLNKQSQFGDYVANSNLQPSHKELSEKELRTEEITTVQS